MKVPTSLELHGQLTPTGESLRAFLKMLQKLWQQLANVINGHISFGSMIGLVVGTPVLCDNLDGVFILTPAVVAANNVTLAHDLNRVPVGYFIVRQVPTVADTPGVVYDGNIAWTTTTITLRFSAAGQYWLVII